MNIYERRVFNIIKKNGSFSFNPFDTEGKVQDAVVSLRSKGLIKSSVDVTLLNPDYTLVFSRKGKRLENLGFWATQILIFALFVVFSSTYTYLIMDNPFPDVPIIMSYFVCCEYLFGSILGVVLLVKRQTDRWNRQKNIKNKKGE